MANITQDIRYRLSLIKYAEKYGVTKAAIKYKTNRQYIYRWKRRYDGSIESLRDRSLRKSSSLPICAGATLIPAWLFSGSSSCSAAIPAPLPAYTGSCAGRA